MPNTAPVVANLNRDGVTFDAGGPPVRLDALSDAAVTDADPFGFEVKRIAAGLSGGPLFMIEVPDGSGRMYVVEKTGTIRILDPHTGAIDPTPFLSVAGQISPSGEEGLLGLALAPDFATTGTFYIYMTNTNGDNEVRRYTTLAGNLNQADPASADRILLIPHPNAANHNAGWIAFGPDNFLYIATGDGAVGANAQSTASLLGKILRIDPSSDGFPGDPDRDYAIPAGNPFAGATPGLDEIWAYGLRNPFRASFDGLNGNLWIGDVGQNLIEEIDLAPAGQGGVNFGWDVREGTMAFTGSNSPAFTPPLTEYRHGTGPFEGNSVTGGIVYRGPIAGLDGHYVFGDFFDQLWSVPVGSLSQGSTVSSSGFTLRNTAFTPDAGAIEQITSFATDQSGNLYITDLGGEIFRVQPAASPNFAGGRLSVEISAGERPAEDRLGFSGGTVTLSDGTNFGSQVSVGGVAVGAIAPNGSGANGDPLVVLFSSGATPARITTLVQAISYTNVAATATAGTRSVTIELVDGAGTSGGGQDAAVRSTSIAVSAGSGAVLAGTSGNDVLVGGVSNDVLDGQAADDRLIGGGGSDSLNGGAGADQMSGDSGNDYYIVDSAPDVVNESGNGGYDIVFALASYTLGTGSEIESLGTHTPALTTPLDLFGNEFANRIVGNEGSNRIEGRVGDDELYGEGGNDRLFGGDGRDSLDGGSSSDTMDGGIGDDYYIVDDPSDTVIERMDGGYDIVFTTVSFTLRPEQFVESLGARIPSGTNAIDLTGNEFANRLVGNAGANTLNGGIGADEMYGEAGNDVYIVDNIDDLALETAGNGNDIVFVTTSYALGAGQNIESLGVITPSGTAAINLIGNEFANRIVGNAGANFINGGLGADELYGEAGADEFGFTTALGGGNVDFLGDFNSADDTIDLENSVFIGLAVGALDSNAFVIGATPQDADDRIIYNKGSGFLLFDADGSGPGGAVLFATVQPGTLVTATDFLVL